MNEKHKQKIEEMRKVFFIEILEEFSQIFFGMEFKEFGAVCNAVMA